MTTYLLDTSIIIDYLRGKKDTVALVDALNGELTSSYLCLSELYEGVYRVREKEEVEKVILQFFKSLSRTYTIDQEVARKFGEIRAQLKLKGEGIEDIDVFIGVTCLVHDLTLVTRNIKHFTHIPHIKIYSQ